MTLRGALQLFALAIAVAIASVAIARGTARRARSTFPVQLRSGGSALPSMPSLGPSDDGTHVTCEGQSNCITFGASPALSTAQEGSNRRAVDETLPALVESSVEGPISGFTNMLRALCSNRNMIASVHACTSCSYDDIKEGSSEYVQWQSQIDDTDSARGSNPYRWVGGYVKHGENDELEGTTSNYCEHLITLRTAKEAYARSKTGQTEPAVFFVEQIASAVELTGEDFRPCLTCLQVRDCMTLDPRRFYVTGPSYNYTYQSTGNDVHLINTAARQSGNRGGYVASEVWCNEVDWRPLMITDAAQSGSTVTLTYHNPTNTTLTFDTSITARELPGEGFTVVCDDRVDNPTIIGTPTIVDEDTITVSLTQPADVGCSIAYAYNNGRDDVGATDATATGGRLRDTNTVTRNSEALRNFAITDKFPGNDSISGGMTGAVAKHVADGSVTDQINHTFAWDFVDCQTSPNWNWLTPYKESANAQSSHADALTPMQLLLDATDQTYTCNVSTGALASSAIGASRVNKAMTVNNAVWRDTTGLNAIPDLPDGQDAVLTAIFEYDGTSGAIFFWNAATNEYIILDFSGTTLRSRWRSSEGAEISRTFSSVVANRWHLFQAWYHGVCPINMLGGPCVDVYLDGTAAQLGVEHVTNFGAINPPLVGLGIGGAQDGSAEFEGSLLWLSLDFGSDAAWFEGESTHDAQWAALCPSPPCGA